MRSIVILLIAGGGLFNCWAIGVLLLEKRRDDRQKKAFAKSLEEISYQLHRARNQR